MRASLLLILLVSSFVLSVFTSCTARIIANANIIRVPSDYATIQQAINAASNGSTILVNSGMYHEHLIVNTTVRLIGTDKISTIIEGDKNRTAITMTANNAVIDGFTIRNCAHPNASFGYGSIELVECNSCTVSDNLLTENECNGILLIHSNGSAIMNNIITLTGGSYDSGLYWGVGIGVGESCNNTIQGNVIARSVVAAISLDNCSENLITQNTILDNNHWGIQLTFADNNTIHHNNFVQDPTAIYSSDSYNNVWDDGARGNYWDDYVGFDDGSNDRVAGDGVGDTALPHHRVDNFPLVQPVEPIPILWENKAYPLTLRCNSTVSAFRFAQPDKAVTFSVAGPPNSTGYCNLTVPKVLLSGDPWKITVNGTDMTSQAIIVANQTHTSIYLAYVQSNHNIQLIGTSVIPEYPAPSIFTLAMLFTILFTFSLKTKKKRSLSSMNLPFGRSTTHFQFPLYLGFFHELCTSTASASFSSSS
jgi:parallel beta-helix repeat protein